MLRQVTPHFYILSRNGCRWSPEQFGLLKKYNLKDIFSPIPCDFAKDVVQGYFYDNQCITKPCKMIMLNFDVKDEKRCSLRGLMGIDFKVDHNNKHYISIRIIGCKSITNTPAKSVKNKYNIKMKTGRDMMAWWKGFARQGNFEYIKLNAMEDVIGFYWKLGWRFHYHRDGKHSLNEEAWRDIIEKLNRVNKILCSDSCWIEKERSKILDKYLDKYLEGYYKETGRNNHCKDALYDIYGILGTNRRHHIGLRYHGYPMYWFSGSPSEN